MRRRLALALSLVALLLFAAWRGLLALLAPERIAALLEQQVRAETGLALVLHRPPTLALWPSPRLELGPFSLKDRGRTLARAEALDAILPWSALLGAGTELERLAIRGLAVELPPAFPRPHDTARRRAPPRLPRVRFPLELDRARLALGPERALALAALQASPLAAGRRFRLEASGALELGDRRQPLALELELLPRAEPEGLALDGIALALALPAARLRGSGSARLTAEGGRLELGGEAILAGPLAPALGLAPGSAVPWRCLGTSDSRHPRARCTLGAEEGTLLELRVEGGERNRLWLRVPRLGHAGIEARGLALRLGGDAGE
ncbi:MAG: hypothetical protein RML12_05270 [Xanthomonadales bacterium]|nr:hypothetical protein [Xanthomonadales bacterium]